MKSITATQARSNFKEVLETAADGEAIIINRTDGNHCVIISLDTYNGLVETSHLLSSPANVKKLVDSILEHKEEDEDGQEDE